VSSPLAARTIFRFAKIAAPTCRVEAWRRRKRSEGGLHLAHVLAVQMAIGFVPIKTPLSNCTPSFHLDFWRALVTLATS
jgi:hypothetical protein